VAEVQAAARRLPPGSDEETQDELGLILQLLPAVERARDAAQLGNLDLAVQALLADPPNRLFAIRLREAAQQAVLRGSFLRSILPGSSASTWVIAGMALLLFVAIPLTLVLSIRLVPDGRIVNFAADSGDVTLSVSHIFIVLIAVAGALGSVISILVRIRDFSEIRILNPPALFWTGFFKPIIGAAFALFVFSAFAADFLSINRAVNQEFMLLTLGFVAGFSERFAPDLVSRIESSLGPGEARAPQSTSGIQRSQGSTPP
jgi:hypothetical protein